MAVEFMDRRNLDFVLYELLGAEDLTDRLPYQDHSRDTFDAILDVAEQIAREKFHNHHVELDACEPVIVDGKVRILPEVKEALCAYAEAGFFAAHHSAEQGGVQLPSVVSLGCHIWFEAANISTTAYIMLTKAAANVIAAFGSSEQKKLYLPPMLDGRFFGTMVLTEPQAGSSLGDIATMAEPTPEGHYLIRGNKIFISAGEHELSENIVHLVLARIKGAPPGVKGLSLFIVPRYRMNPNGSPGEENDVALAGLIHKMGYRGTTSTMLNFGENGQCRGYLLGEPNQGLVCMFQMMNEARIHVGVGAAMLGYAGYLYSLDYARNRPQGRPIGHKDPDSRQVPLMEHPDIRRMLLLQKAYVEGAFALGFYAARLLDEEKTAAEENDRRDAGLLLDILTPLIKAWPSEFCLEANSQAIQVLGGYGYTRDYPVEQYYRSNRLNAIHEGANGIQALDLLGRKVGLRDGRAFDLLMGEIGKTAEEASGEESLRDFSMELRQALEAVRETTNTMMTEGSGKGAERLLANASSYMTMTGHLVIAWTWLRQALVAQRKLGHANEADRDFYRGKLQACRFFFRWELPKVHYQSRILAGLDETCLEMQEAWF